MVTAKSKQSTSRTEAAAKAATRDSESLKDNSKYCFVIMPFGGYFDQYYEKIYLPAIKEAGLVSIRADSLFSTRAIIEDIWHFTLKADVVLADLTGRNPNVYYELGLAHAKVKPTILIAPQEEDIPFDLRHLRILLYDTQEPDWSDKLRRGIVGTIREVIANPSTSIQTTFLEPKAEDTENQPIDLTPLQKEIVTLKQRQNATERTLGKLEDKIKYDSPVYIGPSAKISDSELIASSGYNPIHISADNNSFRLSDAMMDNIITAHTPIGSPSIVAGLAGRKYSSNLNPELKITASGSDLPSITNPLDTEENKPEDS